LLRLVLLFPVLLILVVFALSNPQPVHLGFWPTDYAVQAPLSIAVLVGMGIAFLVGALIVWFSAIAARMRARNAERRIRLLEAEVQGLKARLMPATAPPLAPPDA
jgi:uncharacterized integral membrane protein